MDINDKRVLLCDCEGTMDLDAKAIAKPFSDETPQVYTQLCRSQQPAFQKALNDGDVLIACGREAPLFEELRAELGEDAPSATYVDIREKAAWGANKKQSAPKIAALLAEAALTPNLVESVPLTSEGTILIYGPGEVVLQAGTMLQGRLSPVLVLSETASGMVPQQADLPIFKGTVAKASGHLGDFHVTFKHFAPLSPSAKGELSFDVGQTDVEEHFDLILDLSDGSNLLQKIDGYVKVSSTDTAGLYKALFELSDMVGTFSKPRYALVDVQKCAHARNRIVGCSRCVDACTASAISTGGDAVTIDPYKCEGCGDCSAVCPTGAVAYALPSSDHIHRRLHTVLKTFEKAGGKNPVLLVHDSAMGEEALQMLGQYGAGLPTNVLPFALNSISILDHGLLMSAIAYGAAGVVVLAPAAHYGAAETTYAEIALAQTLLEGFGQDSSRFSVIDEPSPVSIQAALASATFSKPVWALDNAVVGAKRLRNRKVFAHLLREDDQVVSLPAGTPYGQVVVNQDTCSMCMSCVGACPTQALRANADAPILSFVEQDCIQCGICKKTCPEKAIELDARLDLSRRATLPAVLKEDQPAHCTACGKAYASQSSIDTIVKKMSEMPQFADPERLAHLRMCEDCRVIAIAGKSNPYEAGARPKPRTTDDYLKN